MCEKRQTIYKLITAAVIKDDGTWSMLLDTSECDTQLNYTMVVRAESPETGVVTVTISDIRIGEVWVCSGQSNMQFTVGQVREGAVISCS